MPVVDVSKVNVLTIKYPKKWSDGGEKVVDTKDLLCDAFADSYGWESNVVDGGGNEVPNPESKDDHVGRKLVEYALGICRAYNIKSGIAETVSAVESESSQMGTDMKPNIDVTFK